MLSKSLDEAVVWRTEIQVGREYSEEYDGEGSKDQRPQKTSSLSESQLTMVLQQITASSRGLTKQRNQKVHEEKLHLCNSRRKITVEERHLKKGRERVTSWKHLNAFAENNIPFSGIGNEESENWNISSKGRFISYFIVSGDLELSIVGLDADLVTHRAIRDSN